MTDGSDARDRLVEARRRGRRQLQRRLPGRHRRDRFQGARLRARQGVRPVGRTAYQLADGSLREYPFGLVQIEFMGEITAGRVIFGPDDLAPILGVTALESVGITIDPANRTLKRLPAIPLE